MDTLKLGLALSLMSVSLLAGCSGGEEYEVSGEVSSAQTVSGPITLEFFETDPADLAATPSSIHKVELAALGPFTEKIEASAGAKILARALVDSDGNGACTEGELWAETEVVPKEDGTVDPITLDLAATACPTAAPAE